MGERVELLRALTYRDLAAVAVVSQHNFTVMARTLRMVENDFGLSCNFNELGVAKRAFNFCVMCLMATFVPHRPTLYF